MRDTVNRKAYLLYGKPRPGGRTGHTAFVVLKPGYSLSNIPLNNLNDDHVEFYFSMYPNIKPSILHDRSYRAMMLKGVPQHTVNKLEDDLVMRGQSWERFEAWDQARKAAKAERGTTQPKPTPWQQAANLTKFAPMAAALLFMVSLRFSSLKLATSLATPVALLTLLKPKKKKHSIAGPEDVIVSELIATLPSKEGEDAALREKYRRKGQFHEAVQLPAHLDIDKTIASLKKIDGDQQWTMFAPFPKQVANLVKYAPLAAGALFLKSLQYLPPKYAAVMFAPAALSLLPVPAKSAQNCCSAIRCSLKEGGVNIAPEFSLTHSAPLKKALFWLAYAGVMYFGAKHIISSETKFDDALLVPAVYALARFALAMKGTYDYYRDLRAMAKDPSNVPMKQLLPLLSGLLVVNTLFCLMTPNAASSSFIYPSHLFRAAQRAEGASLIQQPRVTIEEVDDDQLTDDAPTSPLARS